MSTESPKPQFLNRFRRNLARWIAPQADQVTNQTQTTDDTQANALDYLHILNESAFKLVDMASEDAVYAYMGETLLRLVDGEAVVLINRGAENGEGFIIQGVYGVEETLLGRVLDLLGYSPVGRMYQSDPEITAYFLRGTLILFEDGLAEMAKRIIAPTITRQIVKLLNLGAIYLIGLRQDDQFYAGVQLYMRGEQTILHPQVIEAFVHQASIALRRLQAVHSWEASEVRYQSLFEQSNDAVFILDLEGKHIQVNQRGADMMGYSPDEIAGLSYKDLVSQQEQSESTSLLQRLRNGERVRPYERTFRRKDGTLVHVELNVEIAYDHAGQPIYIQSIVRDITQRKQLEEQLRQSEAHLRSLIQSETALVMRTNLEGRYTYVNEALARWLGYSSEALIGRYATETVDWIDHETSDEAARLALANPGKPTRVSLSKILTDGTQRQAMWEYIALVKDEGVVDEIQCMGFDITEQHEAEQALRASEERLRTIVENIPVMIGFFDQAGNFEFVNQHLVETLGWTVEDLRRYDEPLSVFYPDPDLRQRVLDYMLSTKSGWRDFETQTKSGDMLTTSWANVRLSDGRSIGIGQDVTEIRQMQRRELDFQLEKERHNLLTHFLQDAAHEFRTPLAAISSSSYLMSRTDDPQRRAQRANKIQEHIQRITRLIDSLLLMTRLESSGIPLVEPVEINQILHTLCAAVAEERAGKQNLCCEIQAEPSRVLGEASYLSDALRQIIDNAYRFTPDGGDIVVQSKTVGTQVWIEVRDTGIGIPQAALPHIFETFWRRDTAHSTPGLGLGLPIARRIIQQHGGEIIVMSEEGHGTTVRVILPSEVPH